MGSGEALNEHITGDRWPDKAARDARLRECVSVIRALLAGEEVSWDGYVRVDRARLWSLPVEPPMLIGAAVSEPTAKAAGGWADGLITINQPLSVLRRVIGAFRGGGGADKPVYVRASGAASYEIVARVMAKLSTSGFVKINLLTQPMGQVAAAAAASPDAGAAQ